MDKWEQDKIPNEKIKKLIDNCTALKMEPDLRQPGWNKAYVYETIEEKFSKIWTKEDIHDNEPIYYYYRIQILGLNKDGYDQEGNYMFVQNWGAFDTINHRKRSDYLPLRLCLQKFRIQSCERSRNFVLAKIKDNNISKNPLPDSVQELIVKYIFAIDFLKKMIEEYTFDIKGTISEFLDVIHNFQDFTSDISGRVADNLGTNVKESKNKEVKDLLAKQINGSSANNESNRTFSLMNFYYKQLHTTINVVDSETDRYRIIVKYFNNSQSSLHGYNLKIENVFEIERPCDNERYTKEMNRKRLLWHGTHRSNIPSILYEGFKTSKARSTGMFGGGIYFANAVSKSVQYCGALREGILLLCEVALGDSKECKGAWHPEIHQDQLPGGKNSIHGIGSHTPDPDDFEIIDNDVLVPCGKIGKYSGVARLHHDEFIVYHPAQVKMRYLITFKYDKDRLNC